MEMNEKIVKMRKGFKGKMKAKSSKENEDEGKQKESTHINTPVVKIIRDMKFIGKPLATCFYALSLHRHTSMAKIYFCVGIFYYLNQSKFKSHLCHESVHIV